MLNMIRIPIACHDTPDMWHTVKCQLLHRGLGVHRRYYRDVLGEPKRDRGYNITHISSGLAVALAAPTVDMAKAALRRIAALMDWDRPVGDPAFLDDAARLRERIGIIATDHGMRLAVGATTKEAHVAWKKQRKRTEKANAGHR